MKPLKYIRLAVRAILLVFWTLGVHWFLIRLPQLFSPGRKLGALSLWGKGLARLMGIRVHELNERTGPMGDLVISNHMGFLDIPVLLSFYPAVFVIKMEMRRVFYLGAALEKQGHIFVERDDKRSMRKAAVALMRAMERGDRVIVFPEGRASPGAERLPFKPGSFVAAKRLGKTVELCAIDYMPDRRLLEWDVERPTLPQLAELFGRRRTDISIEFFSTETVDGDPEEVAARYHDIVQSSLERHDREREEREEREREGESSGEGVG